MNMFPIRRRIALVALLVLPNLVLAQTPNYSEHIAPIIYSNCSSCHHEGAIGPFPLMSYEDAANNAFDIKHAVQERHMPPWPPDPTYSQLAHERVLTEAEIDLIVDWVNADVPEGNPALAPAPPVFNDGPQIGTPDLVTQIETYTVQSSTDEYRCFVVPSNLDVDKYIRAIEVVPGNRSIVHHVLIYYDTVGQCLANDLATPEPGYLCTGSTACGDTRLVGSWVPGSMPQIYPSGLGVPLEDNGWFVIQVHYAPESEGEIDSTKINFKFWPTGQLIRPVFISAPLEHFATLTNGPLVIPPNTIKSFHSQFTVEPLDMSVLAVGPHMHLRGKSIEAFGVHPSTPQDTIKFIRIPDWHFHWQGAYMFPKLVKVPNGPMLHANAVYDNTADNEENPDPNVTVMLGEGSEDEMMLVYFAFTFYLPGDENIVLDSSILITSSPVVDESGLYFNVSPNPANGQTSVYINSNTSTKASLRLIEAQGRMMKEWLNLDAAARQWITESLDLNGIAAGMYFLSLEIDGKQTVRKLSVY